MKVAVAVLAIVTLLVVSDTFGGFRLSGKNSEDPGSNSAAQEASAADNQQGDSAGETGPVPGSGSTGLASEALPPGGPLTEKSSGKYRTVGQPGDKVGRAERVRTYVVEVEDTINAAAYGGDDAFAAMVDATLSNPKGWTADPKFAFQHIANTPDAKPDLRIQLSTQKTTAELCGDDFRAETSCFYSVGNRVLINEARWLRGAVSYEGDLGGYRQYVINHEVGHGIGFAAHQRCPANGDLAPVMMQQTLGLSNDVLHRIDPSDVYGTDPTSCRPNPWPFPTPKA